MSKKYTAGQIDAARRLLANTQDFETRIKIKKALNQMVNYPFSAKAW